VCLPSKEFGKLNIYFFFQLLMVMVLNQVPANSLHSRRRMCRRPWRIVKKTTRRKGERKDGWMDGWVEWSNEGRMSYWVDGWENGWMNG